VTVTVGFGGIGVLGMQSVVSIAISLGCKDDPAWELSLTRRTVSRTLNRLVTQRLVDS
jgi:hypothetical protein